MENRFLAGKQEEAETARERAKKTFQDSGHKKKERKNKKEEEKTKCKKSTRTSWWSKIRKSFWCSHEEAEGGEKRKRGVEVKRGTPRREYAWKMGKTASPPHAAGTRNVRCKRCCGRFTKGNSSGVQNARRNAVQRGRA